MSWRLRLAYPAAVPPRAAATLDALNQLVPVPNTGDKYVDLADWLREAESQGLVTPGECLTLRAAISPNL